MEGGEDEGFELATLVKVFSTRSRCLLVECWTKLTVTLLIALSLAQLFIFMTYTDRIKGYVRSTPVLPQWHVKENGRSAKTPHGRLQLNTHAPLTQRSRSGLTVAVQA